MSRTFFTSAGAAFLALVALCLAAVALLLAPLPARAAVTWANSYSGSVAASQNHISGVTVDSSGNVYLVGYWSPSGAGATLTMGSVTLTQMGSKDLIAAKLDSSGTVVWAKNFGGPAVSFLGVMPFGNEITLDSSGNIYLCADFTGGNPTTPALTKIGTRDATIIKLNSAGSVVWAKNFGGAGATAYCRGIAVDSSGNIYINGDFISANLTTPPVTRIGTQDAFAFKLDSTGAVTWAKNFGGAGAKAYGYGLALDSSNNVHLGGYFNTANLTTPALTLNGTQDALAIKLDSTGAVTWARNFGGAGALAYGLGVAVDGSNNVYLPGYFTGADLTTPVLTRIGTQDAFAFKLDSTGTTSWAKNFGGSAAYAMATAIALDASANIYLGGYFQNANLTTPALTRIGSIDALAIKLDSTGAVSWSGNYGGSGAGIAYGYAITAGSSDNNLYLGGYFATANMTVPPLTNAANRNAFILKQSTGASYTLTVTAPSNGTVSSDTGGISCGATCSASYSSGTNVALTATANTGYSFAGWGGDCTGATNPLTVTMSANKSCTASFTAIATNLTLNITNNGNGTVTSNTGGINCGATCTASIAQGTTVTLTATPSSGYVFSNWGGSCSGSNATTTVTMAAGDRAVRTPAAITCSATFAATTTPTPPPSFVVAPPEQTVANGGTAVLPSNENLLIPSGGENPVTGQVTQAQSPNGAAGGSGEGSFNFASSYSNPSSLTFTAAPASSTPIPDWVAFDPSKVAFDYAVPLPDDLPVQPLAGRPGIVIGDGAAKKTAKAAASWANQVYPLNVLITSVPVNLTARSGTTVYTQKITMDFYAARNQVAVTAVSYSAMGRSGDAVSGRPAIDWDGGQVLFATTAQNIFAAATSGFASVGRYHGASGLRDLLSQAAVPGGGVSGSAYGDSGTPAVALNGTYGAFVSKGTNVSLADAGRAKSQPDRKAVWAGASQVYRVALGYPRLAMTEAVTPAPLPASVTRAGVKADADALNPSLSGDGALVAFESAATSLGNNPSGVSQIWLKSFADGSLTLISAAADGTPGAGDSRNVSLSADGRYAVFDSQAGNLVAGASGRQVYLKDLTTGAITLVSGQGNTPGNAASSDPRIDAKGTAVVFQTLAANLGLPANGKWQVVRKTLSSGAVALVSVAADGSAGNDDSDQPAINADGRFTVFRSKATNLQARFAGNGFSQIWVRNTDAGVTALVSQTDAGAPGSGNAYDPAISGDGGQIAFGSYARDLVNGNPLPGQIHLAANPLPLVARTAFWSPPSSTGNGWIVERSGNQAYIAALAYTSSGGSYWLSGICGFTGNNCAGPLNQWRQTAGRASPTPVGTVSASFAADGASVSLTSSFGGSAQTLTIYAIGGTNTTSYSGLPQRGWWYFPAGASGNDAMDGVGVFLDIDTQTPPTGTAQQKLLATLLSYDGAGQPVWSVLSGSLSGLNGVTADLNQPYGGPQLGRNTSSAVAGQTNLGQATLGFKSTSAGTLTLPTPGAGSKVIGRFPF